MVGKWSCVHGGGVCRGGCSHHGRPGSRECAGARGPYSLWRPTPSDLPPQDSLDLSKYHVLPKVHHQLGNKGSHRACVGDRSDSECSNVFSLLFIHPLWGGWGHLAMTSSDKVGSRHYFFFWYLKCLKMSLFSFSNNYFDNPGMNLGIVLLYVLRSFVSLWCCCCCYFHYYVFCMIGRNSKVHVNP